MENMISFQAGPSEEESLKQLKEFFGTKSTAAAIRSGLQMAVVLARTAKDGVIEVLDQRDDAWLKIQIV